MEIINALERSAIKWLVAKRYKLFLLTLIGILLFIVSFLPFVNLFLSMHAIVIIMFFLAVFVLEVSHITLILFGLSLFIPSMLLLLFERFSGAESIADYIYAIFFAAVIRLIIVNTRKNSP